MAQIDGAGNSTEFSCKDNHCLICGDNQSQRRTKFNMFENSTSDSPDDEILESHLLSLFVLTKVLQYPRENCSEILIKTCGSNPGDWFTLCHQCSSVVKNAYQLTRQIIRLEKQLQHLRTELTVKMGNSFDKEREKDIKHDPLMLDIDIRNEIRNYFRPEEIIVPVKLEIEDIENISSPQAQLDLNDEDNNYSPRNPLPNEESLTTHLETNVSSDSPAKKIKRNKQRDLQTPVRRPGRPLGSKTRHLKKPVPIKSGRYRLNAWLQASDDDSDTAGPRKWKPIDKELYYIYRSLPQARKNPTGEKFPCPICGYSYVAIRKHVRSHQARYAEFACSICKYGAKSQKSLNYHLTIRHKELGLTIKLKPKTEDSHRPQCHICKHTYSNDHKLREHLAFHKKYAKTECPICQFPCVSEKNLEGHTKRCHTYHLPNSNLITKKRRRRKSWKCQHCSTNYSNENEFRNHMAKHVQFSNTTCPVCKFPCDSPQQLESHLVSLHRPMVIVREHSKVGDKFVCGYCRFGVETKEQLNEHLKTAHDIQTDKPFKCDRCDYAAKHSYLLEAHTVRHSILENATVDESTGNYCCKACTAEFATERPFITHFAKAHQSQVCRSLFMCHQCDKSYASEWYLRRHIHNIHDSNNSREYVCDICTRVYSTASQLEEHKKFRHSDAPKRSVCDQCGMTFSSDSTMRKHVRMFHLVLSKTNQSASAGSSGAARSEKKCEHCDLTCVNLKAFKDHLKDAHPELYKFHCTLCPAKYISSCNLRLHMKSCHGEGKESCEWCGVKLKSYSMREHLQSYCKQNPARNINNAIPTIITSEK